MVKILSVNCQGLGDIAKCKDVFNYLRSLDYNIYCLQDTHFSRDLKMKLGICGDTNASLVHTIQIQ
jgi:hypothetical protein